MMKTVLCLASVVVLQTIGAQYAGATCPVSNPAVDLRPVAEAVDAWEKGNDTALTDSAESTVVEKFCDSANGYGAVSGKSRQEIEATASVAVPLYLNAMKDVNTPAMSMDAAVGQALGHNGLSRPEMDRFGILTIKYVHKVDVVRLGSDEQGPWPTFFVLPGDLHVAGIRKSTEVCRADLTIRLGMVTNWSC
jgi:hypothetical protein